MTHGRSGSGDRLCAGSMKQPDLQRQIAAIASLRDPVRRGLYLYVAAQRREVGRDEAARALQISRHLAAFHLDKLATGHLLETSYRRLTGRQGPGAGRPAKLYRRSARRLDFSLPLRRYDLAGRLLAQAMVTANSAGTQRALRRAAASFGRCMGSEALHARRRRRRLISTVVEVLDTLGYEPFQPNSAIRLGNCPFEALANECRSLVCGMNLALVQGVLTGVGVRNVKAELRPRPGSCCVVVERRARRK
jgi:predicted ArsR family transcriptional regulator